MSHQFVCFECGAVFRLKVALEKHWKMEQHGPRAVQAIALHRARGLDEPPSDVYRLRIIK